jgi:hypothetical protein
VVGMVKDRENGGSNFKTSGQCRLQIALLCCAFIRPVLRRCNMHSALNGNIWSKSDFHPSYIFHSHLIPSAFSQLFNQHMFHLLHHTRSEYQKLTYRFLLQIWQIWYFMVICYRYLIERDIYKHWWFHLFWGKTISEIENSQIMLHF